MTPGAQGLHRTQKEQGGIATYVTEEYSTIDHDCARGILTMLQAAQWPERKVSVTGAALTKVDEQGACGSLLHILCPPLCPV